MNAKRCKELRRNLRDRQGIDAREVEYHQTRTWRYQGTRTLNPTCGRAVYQAAKKAGAA